MTRPSADFCFPQWSALSSVRLALLLATCDDAVGRGGRIADGSGGANDV